MDRQEDLVGGLARNFFEAVRRTMGSRLSELFEPHVAEQTLTEMLSAAKVEAFVGARLAGLAKSGPRIRTISTTSGGSFSATVFPDAGYEGDLMKAAGVS